MKNLCLFQSATSYYTSCLPNNPWQMLETHLHKCPYAPIAGLVHKHGIPIKEKLRTINILQIKFIFDCEAVNSIRKKRKNQRKERIN